MLTTGSKRIVVANLRPPAIPQCSNSSFKNENEQREIEGGREKGRERGEERVESYKEGGSNINNVLLSVKFMPVATACEVAFNLCGVCYCVLFYVILCGI